MLPSQERSRTATQSDDLLQQSLRESSFLCSNTSIAVARADLMGSLGHGSMHQLSLRARSLHVICAFGAWPLQVVRDLFSWLLQESSTLLQDTLVLGMHHVLAYY